MKYKKSDSHNFNKKRSRFCKQCKTLQARKGSRFCSPECEDLSKKNPPKYWVFGSSTADKIDYSSNSTTASTMMGIQVSASG